MEAPATKLIACYGSLKKGFYNHKALGLDAEFLGTVPVWGVMYWNGSYPKLYKANGNFGTESLFDVSKQAKHEVEIYRISPECAKVVSIMEEGAGYVAEEIETPYGAAVIYYMPHARFDSDDEWIPEYSQELLESVKNV